MILAATEFLRNAPEGKYDAIIVDSSDPVGMFYLSFISFIIIIIILLRMLLYFVHIILTHKNS